MNIKTKILPKHDSDNSYPEEIDFLVDNDQKLVEIELQGRVVSFKQEDIIRLVKTFDL